MVRLVANFHAHASTADCNANAETSDAHSHAKVPLQFAFAGLVRRRLRRAQAAGMLAYCNADS